MTQLFLPHDMATPAQQQAITPPYPPHPCSMRPSCPPQTDPPRHGPAVRQRCPHGGGGRQGGDRGTLVMCRRGAPRVQRFNVALVQHRPSVSPLTLAAGPGCPRMDEGDKLGGGGLHTAPAWSPLLCTRTPRLPPPRLALATSQGTGRGTRSRFPVILGRINQAGDRCRGVSDGSRAAAWATCGSGPPCPQTPPPPALK